MTGRFYYKDLLFKLQLILIHWKTCFDRLFSSVQHNPDCCRQCRAGYNYIDFFRKRRNQCQTRKQDHPDTRLNHRNRSIQLGKSPPPFRFHRSIGSVSIQIIDFRWWKNVLDHGSNYKNTTSNDQKV